MLVTVLSSARASMSIPSTCPDGVRLPPHHELPDGEPASDRFSIVLSDPLMSMIAPFFRRVSTGLLPVP